MLNRISVACLLIVLTAGSGWAVTRNVPSSYSTIQAAINAAVNGDVVVVAAGRYKENIDFKGKAITVQSTVPTNPAVVAATIIDGNKAGSVVTFRNHELSGSVLTGLTITNGTGTNTSVDYRYGGGVFCGELTSPTITNNIISGNSATGNGDGGGVYCFWQSSPTLTNNTISDNSARNGGGVRAYWQCWPVLSNNIIRRNTATNDGGGVSCSTCPSSMRLTDNTISSNTATAAGGGIGCSASSPVIANNTISDNSSGAAAACIAGAGTTSRPRRR